MDLRVDGKFASDEDIARLAQIFAEKGVDLSRPIRHWTIDHVRALHGDMAPTSRLCALAGENPEVPR